MLLDRLLHMESLMLPDPAGEWCGEHKPIENLFDFAMTHISIISHKPQPMFNYSGLVLNGLMDIYYVHLIVF